MRILDIVHRHLDGVERLVDLTPQELDLPGQVQLPEGVAVVRDVPGPYGDGDLVAVVLGGHPDLPTDDAAAHEALGSMTRGARALVLAGAEGREFAFHRLLATAVAHMLQVRQVAGFERMWPRTGVLLEAVDHPRPPTGYYGPSSATAAAEGEPADGVRSLLRLQNEYVLSDYVARGARTALADAEEKLGTQRGGRDQVDELRHRNGVLAGELRDATEKLRRAERRVAALESSTSMRLGRAVVEAARRPGRSTLQLPRNLYRSFRARGSRPPSTSTPSSTETADPDAGDHHFLDHTVLAPRPRRRPVIGAVVTDRTAELLAPSCDLVRLLPNDALALVLRSDPDLVLVEAAAARPGQPWAHLGTPYAPERAQELLAAVDAAQGAQRPVVLWLDVPESEVPGLARLGTRFDLVTSLGAHDQHVRWSPGVQLALFNPVGATARAGVVARGSLDARLPLRERTSAEQLVAATAGHEGSRVLPDTSVMDPLPWPEPVRDRVERAGDVRTGARALRGAVAGTATSSRPAGGWGDDALEVLASGCRVVVTGEAPVGDEDALAALVHAGAPADAGRVVADAVAAGPPTQQQVRQVLRVLAAEHSVGARLGRLARALAIEPVRVGPSVAVLASVADDEDLRALALDLLHQSDRADELVLHASPGCRTDHVRAELEGAGLKVRQRSTAAGPSASATDCEWFLGWDGAGARWGSDHLADLRAATMLVEADVVGFRDGAELTFVDDLPWSGSLVRTEAVHRWGEPADGSLLGWSRAGARLLALDPAVGSRPAERAAS